MKNYCVITNTLLRKAAQKGGVHPIYINETSSAFAHKIEKMLCADECRGIICDMFRAYCRLVRKHSMQGFSLAVQKAVIVIDSDISANLSLSTLSEMQGISPGYLSAIFKRDTGKTVSEYIRERRMNHAMHLLATTQLQIQTVALYCGIMDLQYFSKIFKKYTGMTPKDYREKASQRKATK
jgi:YesN/AraC family two-component response regulator